MYSARPAPAYRADGGYWLGAIWPSTQYMVLRGLGRAGRDDLAHAIACNHVANVTKVFEQTGTLWENYAPESAAAGNPARRDFVGWAGIGPITVLLENVLGIRPAANGRGLIWDIRLLEGHGVRRYPLGGGGWIDLTCGPRQSATDAPDVQVTATGDVTADVKLRWEGGSRIITAR